MSAQQAGDDALNQYLIDLSYRNMMAAKTEERQRFWCDRLKHYVGQRSPERIREMELEKGLV